MQHPVLPHRDPQWTLLVARQQVISWFGNHQEALRYFHLAGKARKFTVQRSHLSAHQQLQLPRLAGVEAGFFAQDEDVTLTQSRGTLGLDTPQAPHVGIVELVGAPAMVNHDAVINTTTHKAGPLEGVTALRHDRQCVLTLAQLRHQLLELALTQQVAPHRRHVEVGEIEIDEGVVLAPLRCGFDTFGIGADKCRVHLATGQVQMPDGALFQQRIPARLLEQLIPHRGTLCRATFKYAQLAGHAARRAHDAFAHHHYSNGGPRYRIDLLIAFALLA